MVPEILGEMVAEMVPEILGEMLGGNAGGNAGALGRSGRGVFDAGDWRARSRCVHAWAARPGWVVEVERAG
jgi:hypothetical protein